MLFAVFLAFGSSLKLGLSLSASAISSVGTANV
jgi:hypothetical protein